MGGQGPQPASDEPAFELRVAHQQVERLAPGPNTVTFPYRFTAPGDYLLQVRIDNDVLELDDTRSAVVTVKNSVPIMLVDGKSTEARAARPRPRSGFASG